MDAQKRPQHVKILRTRGNTGGEQSLRHTLLAFLGAVLHIMPLSSASFVKQKGSGTQTGVLYQRVGGGAEKKSHNTKKTIHSACSTLDDAWGQLTKLKLFLQTEHYLFTFINQSVHNDHSTKPAGRDAQEQLIDSLSVPAVDSSPDRLRTASSNDHEKQRDPKLRDTHTILIL